MKSVEGELLSCALPLVPSEPASGTPSTGTRADPGMATVASEMASLATSPGHANKWIYS